MFNLVEKSWKSVSEFGSVYFYLFLVAFMYLLNYKNFAIILFYSLIVSYIISLSIRAIYFKDRPKKQKYNNWIDKLDASSFPSMHTMRIAILFVMFTKFFGRYDIGSLFLAMTIIVAISRSVVKKHFWTDIIAGFFFGLIIGQIMFTLL